MKKNLYRRKMLIHMFVEEVHDDDIEELLCATHTRLAMYAECHPHSGIENTDKKVVEAIEELSLVEKRNRSPV